MTDQIAEYQGKDFKMGEYEIRDDFCGHINDIVGACFYDRYEEFSFDQLYRKADRAMYQSKKQKGCSAVIYGEEM